MWFSLVRHSTCCSKLMLFRVSCREFINVDLYSIKLYYDTTFPIHILFQVVLLLPQHVCKNLGFRQRSKDSYWQNNTHTDWVASTSQSVLLQLNAVVAGCHANAMGKVVRFSLRTQYYNLAHRETKTTRTKKPDSDAWMWCIPSMA